MAAALGALEMQAVYLGDRLGLYRALADEGPATPAELGERAGIHPRYAREWLEQQAVAGVLDVDDAAAASYLDWLADPTVDTERRGADVVYDCSERLGGTVCQYTTKDQQYDTDFAETVLVRDGVVVTVRQSNYPTDDLLGAIVDRIWG